MRHKINSPATITRRIHNLFLESLFCSPSPFSKSLSLETEILQRNDLQADSTTIFKMPQKHEYSVEMTCSGCSGAIERILKKQEGIANFEIDLENRKVWVETDRSSDDILQVIKKAGKETSYNGSK